MKKPLRICFQEADDDIRQQLESDLKTDNRFQLMQAYKSLVNLINDFETSQADVLLINWNFNHPQLFDFITSLKSKNATTKILITFDFIQPDFVSEILKLGASGFLLKPFTSSQIFKTISEKPFQINPKKLELHVNRLMS